MKLLSWFILLISSVTYALDMTPNNSREIHDLMYLPESGTVFTEISFKSTNTDSDTEYLTKNLVSESEKEIETEFQIGSSINDRFAWAIEVPYTLKEESETKYGPASTQNGVTEKEKSKGLQDISLSLKYRLKDQSTDKVNFDVELSFSPKTGDSEKASTTKDGNAYRGGSDLGISLEIGKKFNEFSVAGVISLEHSGKTESKLLSDDTTTKAESYNTLALGIAGQFRPIEKVYLNTMIALANVEDHESVNDGTRTEIDSNTVFLYAFSVGYIFTKSSTFEIGYMFSNFEMDLIQDSMNLESETDISKINVRWNLQF